MADFNKQMIALQSKSTKIQTDLLTLLREYDSLYREANTIYVTQRMASGDAGLEDFHRLLLVIRRNRDVMGSLIQGSKSIRPMDQFKFIEEDLEQKKKETPAQIRKKRSKKEVQAAPAELGDIEAEQTEKELEVIHG